MFDTEFFLSLMMNIKSGSFVYEYEYVLYDFGMYKVGRKKKHRK